jgi:hypothetical protein
MTVSYRRAEMRFVFVMMLATVFIGLTYLITIGALQR